MGAKVKAYDPEAMEVVQTYYPQLDIEYVDNQYEAAMGVDALVIVTEWNEFRAPDFDRIKAGLKAPVIFDGRNVYELDRVESLGFTYHSIGRKSVIASETITTNE